MSRYAYVNGQYVQHGQAAVHIEDRGYQFADGIYEVCEVKEALIIDKGAHLDRLERSACELSLKLPFSRKTFIFIMEELCRKNKVRNGLIYLQVTRGVAPRNHPFPDLDTPPAIVMTTKSTSRAALDKIAAKGIGVITIPDNRWERVDIKTTSLLPNVLAKQKAKEAGVYEAWFVDGEGKVTEGSSTNVWIVTQNGTLVTRDAGAGILKGITRAGVFKTAEKLQMKVEERRFSVEEAQMAREAFITSATTVVMPVTEIDGKKVGNGMPGNIALKLRDYFYNSII